MALPYPTKVVLPFDIATAQDMNERHANDVALANGTGLDDGSVGPNKRSGGFYIGSFTVSSTGAVTVSGLSFQPKLVELKTLNSTTDSYAEYNTGSFDSDGNQEYSSMRVAGANNFTRSGADSCLGYYSTPGGTITRYMELVYSSMNSDGFTLNNTTHTGGPYTVRYRALG